MRKTHRRELLRIARRRQRDVLCHVMLSAQQCETWLTLDELAKLTHYPPASISAQLRHFRAELEGHGEIPVAAGLPRTVERVGGGFRAGGKIGARGAGLGFAHGAVSALLPGTRPV